MQVQNLLQKASFRGAEFFVNEATTGGGRKTVTHEFPNTDRRVIEDLGKKQRTFIVEAIVSGTGQDYYIKRDTLLAALETAGAGILVHPFYGSVSVVNDPYTIVEAITDIGRARLTITFHRADSNIYPESTGSNKTTVITKAQAGITASETATAKKFTAPKVLSNIQDGAAKLNGFANKISAQVNTINQYSNSLAVVSASVTAFTDSVNSMMQAPAIMAANISAMYSSLLSLAATPGEALKSMQSMFGFGADDSIITQSTATLMQRQANRDALNNAIKVAALSTAYSIVPTFEFKTVEDINTVSAVLDAEYESLSDTLDPEVYAAMEDLRNEVRTFLDNAAITAWKVSSVNSPNVPATILAFMYYGGVDEADTLIALNGTKEPSFVDGATEILTQ